MVVQKTTELSPEVVVHRVGGSSVEMLRLTAGEQSLNPPGFSVLIGGEPRQAAEQIRARFPTSRKWKRLSGVVGSGTVAQIRQAGFDVMSDPTPNLSNHARVIHPNGAAGFSDENLMLLAQAFHDTM